MTLIVAAAAHGSPGVSTALQLVASLWPDGRAVPVIVEADASGGVFAARYELSIMPGFLSLAESLRKAEAPALLDHAQRLPSGVACVPISASATAASAQLRSAGPYLGSYLAESGHPVLVDTGTLLPDAKISSAIAMADLLLWFVRPTREELLVLRHRMAECPQPENVGVVLVGSTPYNAEQVGEALDVEVLHSLPIDRRGASATNLGGHDRFLRRSQLARSCARLAELLSGRSWADSVPSDAPTRSPDAPPEARETRGRFDDNSDRDTEPEAPADEVEIEVWHPEAHERGGADESGGADDEELVVWVNDGH